MAIATELRQLIDYHNVRVYRLAGDELIPVAMQGQVGEYVDETPDQLQGRGRRGHHRLGRRARASPRTCPTPRTDPRADTIPGTEDDLDESMLLAPMTFDDKVLGVLVLSKLGLHQFTDDDLRLLVIYASFAAQAMANADTTERLREQTAALERQLRSQRELLQITESILTQLDGRMVLESITERLGGAHRLRQHRHRGRRPGDRPADAADGARRPRGASTSSRGSRARRASRPGWSSTTSPTYIEDERHDPRVNQFRADRRPGRQPHRRAAARSRRRDRRPDDRAARHGQPVLARRSSSSSSCSRRRSRSPCRTPRSSARSRSAPRPTT